MNKPNPTKDCVPLASATLIRFFMAAALLLLTESSSSQHLPLHWPLLTPSPPSGSFGEIRSNHFHAGIDLKTGSLEGIPVRAAEDGFVSRIKVSNGGYGKALYITHKEGVTTVYGHLSEFYEAVSDTVLRSQYEMKQFETELFPDADRFPVRRGQIIGYSGNTGSSQGPHLHFETRHTTSEIPFDPGFAGVAYQDTIPPVIDKVYLYTPGPYGWLYHSQRMEIRMNDPAKQLSSQDSVPETFFIGLEVWDKANHSDSKLGVRQVRISVDNRVVYDCRIDSFAFHQSSMVKAMTDPEKPGVFLCLKMPGNHLPFFKSGNGLIQIPTNKPVTVLIEVTDNSGNRSTGSAGLIAHPDLYKSQTVLAPPVNQDFDLFEPMRITVTPKGKKLKKKVTIDPQNAIFSKSYTLPIEKAKKLKLAANKVVVVKTSGDGSRVAVPSSVDEGFIKGRISSGGTYGLAIDTVAPAVATVKFTGIDLRGNLIFETAFTETLSGLKSATGTLNNDWVLTGFYTNRDVIFWVIPPEKLIGTGTARLVLEDKCGNRTEREMMITDPTAKTGQ